MERRQFLQLAVGFAVGAAAGATALTAGAVAAPLSPQPLGADQRQPPANPDIHSAVTTEAEVQHLKPEQVHWHHRWRHRHWRRRWHRRHW